MSQPIPDQPDIPVPPVQVKPRASSKLAQLLAVYGQAKARRDQAEEDFKAVVDQIKAEVTAAHPDAQRFDLVGPAGAAPLSLSYVERWTVDSRKLKAEDPETYVRFAKKGGSWQLRVAQGGDS